jgi:U3 small nucleolar RNA-associated protein 12
MTVLFVNNQLPVMTMDISSDNTLLITGSADKNVKIWGLDFGDCHKSIFAHGDSVMQVKFVPNTHYFFTCSKDHTIKYWDGDKFEQIMKLDGHHGEVWTMCLSRYGSFIVSAGHDRSIRVWEKTDEQLFLEEERERELEESYEKEYVEVQDRPTTQGDDDVDEVAAATKKTVESLKAGERIMEALDLLEQEKEKWDIYHKVCLSFNTALTYKSLQSSSKMPPPDANPLLAALGNISPEQHALKTLEKIRAGDLDEALLVLPFSQVLSLLRALSVWVENGWNTPLASRILIFLLKANHHQITANRSDDGQLRPLLDKIRSDLRREMQNQKDLVGFNLAAMKLVRRQWEQEHVSEFVDWEQEMATRAGQVKSGNATKSNKKPVKTVVKPTLIGA